MKKILQFIILFSTLSGLNTQVYAQSKNKTKQKNSPVKEKGALFFDKTFIDLASIGDAETSVPVEFTFHPISKAPVKILDVKVSCNCLAADWPKEALNFNQDGKITVRFFPKGQSGMQEKNITVFTDGQPAVYNLKIVVFVNDKNARIQKEYPESQGNLKFSSYDLHFKTMFTEGKDSINISVYNPTSNAIKISGFRFPAHLLVEPTAMQILPLSAIGIKIKYYPSVTNDYGRRKDNIIMVTNDVSFPEKKLIVSAEIVENFSTLTEKQKANPPIFEAVTPVVDLDTISNKSVVTATFIIKNTGKSPMYIRKAFGSCGCTDVKYDSTKPIKRNKEAKIIVTYSSTYEIGMIAKNIYVITNTPQKTMHEMVLKANIVYKKKP